MNVKKQVTSVSRSVTTVLDLMPVAVTLAIVWMGMDCHAMV